jgi:hypothetical protein
MAIGWHFSNETAVAGGPGAGHGGARSPAAGDAGRAEASLSSRAEPWRRGKVVLLRTPRQARETERSETVGPRLDLHAAIDSLRSVRGDLDALYWGRQGQGDAQASERYQISLWIRLVGERTAALEGILMHMGGPAIVLPGLQAAGCEELRRTTTALTCWLYEEDSFEDVARAIAAILHAADTICLSAAAGRPA